MLDTARQTGMASVVVTFDRSPREVLDPSFHPQMLTTLAEKKAIMAQLGMDYLGCFVSTGVYETGFM